MKLNKLLFILEKYKDKFGGDNDIILSDDFVGQTSIFIGVPDKIQNEIVDYFNSNTIDLGYDLDSRLLDILESGKLIETSSFIDFLKENRLSDVFDITCALREFIRHDKELSIPIRLENVQQIYNKSRVMVVNQRDIEEWMSAKEGWEE
ncbi:MAG: hypothetical protein WC679_13880 [Bacteroidales bacterium]|jgi:hypothetical protein